MFNILKTGHLDWKQTEYLFAGERLLVITGLLGFILAAGIATYIFFQDPIIMPEGNMMDAFSFNAAIGIFIMSIAAILPLAKLGNRNRKVMRWLYIIAAIYSYAIETVQNLRGLNPRFTHYGSVYDSIAGMLFGLISLQLIILTLLLMIRFFRLKAPLQRPLLILGIRYAFLSVFIANLAGIWMILLQDRMTGEAGNIIVLHGISFHALQTLILPGWLLERAQVKTFTKKLLIHFGSIAWMLSILLIGIQTALGQSVFEQTLLPILAGLFLLMWLATIMTAFGLFFMNTSLRTKQKLFEEVKN